MRESKKSGWGGEGTLCVVNQQHLEIIKDVV